MALTGKRMTAEELWRMPDDGMRHELIYGELRTMAPSSGEHGWIALNVGGPLREHVRAMALGRAFAAETGFMLARDPDLVRAPDAAFVSRERVEALGRVEGFWPGAPDLAVEVVSPGDTHAEVTEKALAWLAAGSRMVLVADPSRHAVTVYRSREDIRILVSEAGDVIDGADVVPGWKLPVAEVFA